MSRPDGGPAFPTVGDTATRDGMTLRDYFAAAALCGFWACDRKTSNDFDEIAMQCYQSADAMLAARSRVEK